MVKYDSGLWLLLEMMSDKSHEFCGAANMDVKIPKNLTPDNKSRIKPFVKLGRTINKCTQHRRIQIHQSSDNSELPYISVALNFTPVCEWVDDSMCKALWGP